jgi:hypothetical protein
MAMSEDMPCCPTKAPIPDCGKDCLFMAMCATLVAFATWQHCVAADASAL